MATDEHQTPGEPPAVHDEAADSPFWLPALGLTLLLMGAIFVVWQSASADGLQEEVAPAAEVAGTEAAGDEAAGNEAAGDDAAGEPSH